MLIPSTFSSVLSSRSISPSQSLNPERMTPVHSVVRSVADETSVLKSAMKQLYLSARAFHRILKLARTIADLAQAKKIAPPHVAEALSLRSLDRRI